MERVLVSSCLLGRKVRYNGSDKLSGHPVLERWVGEGRVVPLCPEVAVGFPVPRPPAEISGGRHGSRDGRVDGLGRDGRVLERDGRDVTDLYRRAARVALDLARAEGCRYAVLTDGSPSCGSTFVYDGAFRGSTVPGRGTTAALLAQGGVRVFSEAAIGDLDRLLRATPHAEG